MRIALALILIVLSGTASARKAVPLMPESQKRAGYRKADAGRPRASYGSYRYYRDTAKETAWGFQAGVLGRQQNADGFLGLTMQFGGRITAEFPLWNRFRLRPSVGYFHGSTGEAGVTVSEHTIEAGVGLFYPLGRPKPTRFQVGMMNRLDASIARISVLESSGSSGIGFLYRVGPAIGMVSQMGNRSAFVLDFETTFAVTHNFRFHTGLTAGFLFALD